MRPAETDRSTSVSPVVRRFARVPIDALVLLLTGVPRAADYAFNISEGGLCVDTAAPLGPGTLTDARIALPRAPGPLDVMVRVAWSEEDSMGLQFLAPAPSFIELVRRALHRRQ